LASRRSSIRPDGFRDTLQLRHIQRASGVHPKGIWSGPALQPSVMGAVGARSSGGLRVAKGGIMLRRNHPSSRHRALALAAVVLPCLMVVTVERAAADMELVPSVGLSRAVEGSDETKTSGGLALRATLGHLFMTEVGASYRSESRFNDQLKVRMWPVTASLYLRPVRQIYAGAGVGWYQTSFDYADSLGIPNSTHQEFGVHAGGGVEVPLASNLGVDLNGRYVWMRPQDSRLVPEKFNPDFWNLALGLAIHF
jgi:opacity protein-like surface antigen